MKLIPSALAATLIYASVSAALPSLPVSPSETSAIQSSNGDSATGQSPSERFHERKPAFLDYIRSLRHESKSPVVTEHSAHYSASSSHEADSDNARDRAFRDHYGAVFGKSIAFSVRDNNEHTEGVSSSEDAHQLPKTSATNILTYLKSIDVLDLLDKHGPECVGIAIFILIPIAYLVLGMIELALAYCTTERFPHRGRERVRLVGEERQLRAFSNRQREEMLASEKSWWESRKSHC
ncbi:hypothetical protein POX_g08856 [Penicillium oxalicum]|uniref:hypothetical protein n=1 Tax=Penicillium oxalicum TaxID=69781 RepID=UPI0020B687D7|nr:hypothetical protein POX_g08856 [Penicillium oxalicum]KAI2786470.1 hypothetical protein POX_g08856 [Penicillium oxalicum]